MPSPRLLAVLGAELAVYAAVLLLLGPGELPLVAALAALVTVGAPAFVLRDVPEDDGRAPGWTLAAALWPPIHLLLIATAGTASPLLALVALWLAWQGFHRDDEQILGAAAIAAALMLGHPLIHAATPSWWPPTLTVALGAGAALALRRRGATPAPVTSAPPTRNAPTTAAPPEADFPDAATLASDALESVRQQTAAVRATLWEVDARSDRAVPWLTAGGEVPRPRPLAGDPMRWVLEERLPLRLEHAPRSMAAEPEGGAALIVPVEPDRLLTLDYAIDALPDDATAARDAGRYLATLLHLSEERRRSVAMRERFQGLMELLRRLSERERADRFAQELVEAAMVLTGGTGAAAARWTEEEGGEVLACAGSDGGPRPGETFSARESEMSLAARAAAASVRDRVREHRRMPIATTTERWFATPRLLALLPLVSGDDVEGVLAVWNADRSHLDQEGLDALATIAPYAALGLERLTTSEALRARVDVDALTELPNRGAFNERLAQQVAHYGRYPHPLSMLLLDVDHFKRINDTHGHEAGDEVLRRVGALLAANVRETDFAARFGGEEFVMVLPETSLGAAVETAERIRQALREMEVEWAGSEIPVRASFGVASCPESVTDPTELLRAADTALYAAKEGGRDRVTAAEPPPPNRV